MLRASLASLSLYVVAAAGKGEGKIAPNGNLVCLLRMGGVGAEGRDSVSLGWAVVSSKRRRSRVLNEISVFRATINGRAQMHSEDSRLKQYFNLDVNFGQIRCRPSGLNCVSLGWRAGVAICARSDAIRPNLPDDDCSG